ncbi:hypothetical protein SAMN05661010_03752 [Modicisalibacter muralis]|uniref:Uncharacterized protein n=1 Tax=Modicisalibacter muralis TaxID=119000 RepID=A0A1G9RMI7_9GAMM|nr:hypothetical protein [Halomonas muralis]SDM24498.1 hypothetical protein SAMN05661010_03752 [Halomonas muralis]
MSLSAIIIMLVAITMIWGIATLALIHTMRQESRKLELLQVQGGFEPFSPTAQQDIEGWLARHPSGESAHEMRELLEFQHRSLRDNPRRFYHWPNPDIASKN